MQIKTIAMVMAVGCAAAVLSGCGVPQKDFDAKVSELNSALEQVESLKGKNADLESLLNSERSKSKDLRIELTAAAKRIAALKKAEAQAASSLADQKAQVETLDTDLTAARSALETAKERAETAEAELAKLQKKCAELEKRLEQYKRNMHSLGGSTPAPASAPVSAPTETAPAGGSLQILDEMSQK